MGNFKKNDQSFECVNCKEFVPKLRYSSRNHCNRCLCSLHLDIVPGDRQAECGGLLRPVAIEYNSKKGYVIVHKCEKCNITKRNKAAADDNMQLIIDISSGNFSP